MSIELDDADRAILRQCPFSIFVRKYGQPSADEARRMARVKRLWQAGLVRGSVFNAGTLDVKISDAGRVAIGRVLPGDAPCA